MKRGKKYINNDVIYVTYKKHMCPICANKLETVKVSKIVNYNSPEAANYDFSFGAGKHKFVATGDVEFVWKEFDCPKCKKHFTVDELKRIEGVETDEEDTDNPKGNTVMGFVVFFAIGIIIAVIIGLLKNHIN